MNASSLGKTNHQLGENFEFFYFFDSYDSSESHKTKCYSLCYGLSITI